MSPATASADSWAASGATRSGWRLSACLARLSSQRREQRGEPVSVTWGAGAVRGSGLRLGALLRKARSLKHAVYLRLPVGHEARDVLDERAMGGGARPGVRTPAWRASP